MLQSLAKVIAHLVYSTKHRRNVAIVRCVGLEFRSVNATNEFPLLKSIFVSAMLMVRLFELHGGPLPACELSI